MVPVCMCNTRFTFISIELEDTGLSILCKEFPNHSEFSVLCRRYLRVTMFTSRILENRYVLCRKIKRHRGKS